MWFPALKFTENTAYLYVLCVNGLVSSSLRAIRMHVYRKCFVIKWSVHYYHSPLDGSFIV